MIVVEGCDGTGKTTLAKQLAEELNLQFGKRGTENRDDLYKVTRQDTYSALAHAVRGSEPPLIWDRLGWISEPIYAPAMGRKVGFTAGELAWIHKAVRMIGCPVIVCIVPYELALENARKDHQMMGVLSSFANIYQQYRRFLTVNNWVWPYDYTREDSAPILDVVEKYVNRRKEREWRS